MTTTLSKSGRIGALLGLAASMAIGATSTPAHASVTALVSVTAIEYVKGELLIQTNTFSAPATSPNFYGTTVAVTTPDDCTVHNVNVDTLKAWQALATSAMLSGKKVKIYYTRCSTWNYISAVDLWN